VRARHYSRRTEHAYVAWIRRYILKLVSLCGTSLSTRNRESAIVAGIPTRAPWTLAAVHLHMLKGARRCGDIKGRQAWVRLDLPRPISAIGRRVFLRELRMRYAEKERWRR
jgi:hypothetical protein